MAVNQSQVDHIITAASEDDPEVKLQNLEREVSLLKTSIKRIMMDIRERMNDLENPFILGNSGVQTSSSATDLNAAKKSALEAKEAALDARESQIEAETARNEQEQKKSVPEKKPEPERKPEPVIAPEPMRSPVQEERKMLDEEMLNALRAQISPYHKSTIPPPVILNEKLRLQKVYQLFKWTTKSVKKYGHDRLDIILGSYQAMGYISKESCEEIREISRLMPSMLGEEHEVGPDEFVSELYSLNRILVPNDTSLDRDMIEVMMEQRQQAPPTEKVTTSVPVTEEIGDPSRFPMREKKISPNNKEKNNDWMGAPDRI